MPDCCRKGDPGHFAKRGVGRSEFWWPTLSAASNVEKLTSNPVTPGNPRSPKSDRGPPEST